MTRDFELFVALRYLRAKRKQAVISVITLLSVLGVAAGVMALIIALAINNGFRNTLQKNLLGATAHVRILEKIPGPGIQNWPELSRQLQTLAHVTSSSASLYGEALLVGPQRSTGAILKGVDTRQAGNNEVLQTLKAGSLERLRTAPDDLPGIVLGSRLAQNTGMLMESMLQVIIPNGDLTPLGPRPATYRFRVVGIFESGFYELDANWAYTSLKTAQRVLGAGDVVNTLELRVDDIYQAPAVASKAAGIVGKDLAATHWMEDNKPILSALSMERIVTVITIGLIQLIAALNILVALVMAVMEKYKDIAILMAMGARRQQIRMIFVLQGVLIGVVGSLLGVAAGHALSFLANKYRWIQLNEEVYSLAFVPFDARPFDAVWIVAVAVLISFVATLYPARNATKIAPVEALRYE